MQTRILMTLSALFMAVLGVVASFMPQEVLIHTGTLPEPLVVTIVQAAGALYLAFAMLNWMARGVLIGGIYARPVGAGNFVHFTIVTITLIKVLFTLRSPLLITLAAIYTVFAVWFALVIFTPSGRSPKAG